MSNGEAVVRALPPTWSGGWTAHRGVLEVDGHSTEVRFDVRVDDPPLARTPAPLRPMLLALLPAAMVAGRPVVVDGPVDRTSLEGLAEWQEAMACWHPGGPRPVSIRSEGEPAPPGEGVGGVAAFSGGVDSCFTAWRHSAAGDPASGDQGVAHRRAALALGVMVHGFDIPVAAVDDYDGARERSRRILHGLGLGLGEVRTDVRHLEQTHGIDWETMGHGIWLAAALALFDAEATHSVIPSTYPYDQQRLPWASNPLTDPLLGSCARPLWHDGAAHDKLAKVGVLAGVPCVTQDVRVCWEGHRADRNCGRCFKCVVTQACFWVSGVAEPGAFDVRADVADVAGLELKDPYKVRLGRRLHAAADRIGDRALAGALAAALTNVGVEP